MRRRRAAIAMKRGRYRNCGPCPACPRDPRADGNRDEPRRRTARQAAPGPVIGRSSGSACGPGSLPPFERDYHAWLTPILAAGFDLEAQDTPDFALQPCGIRQFSRRHDVHVDPVDGPFRSRSTMRGARPIAFTSSSRRSARCRSLKRPSDIVTFLPSPGIAYASATPARRRRSMIPLAAVRSGTPSSVTQKPRQTIPSAARWRGWSVFSLSSVEARAASVRSVNGPRLRQLLAERTRAG